MKKSNPKMSRVPMAFTADGKIVVNLAHVLGAREVRQLRDRLGDLGGRIFVGVEVPGGLRRQVAREGRDVLDDVVGRVGHRVRGSQR